MSDGPTSPRTKGVPVELSQVPLKGHKTVSKKKMKDTIKVMFKTEKKKKDKSRHLIPKNVKLLREFLEHNCMQVFLFLVYFFLTFLFLALRLEGIMRVSGNQNEVKKLKALLDSGKLQFVILLHTCDFGAQSLHTISFHLISSHYISRALTPAHTPHSPPIIFFSLFSLTLSFPHSSALYLLSLLIFHPTHYIPFSSLHFFPNIDLTPSFSTSLLSLPHFPFSTSLPLLTSSIGEPVDLSTYTDHNIIAGAFKMMFREMPEPLLTFDLYKNFLGAHGIFPLFFPFSHFHHPPLLPRLPSSLPGLLSSILSPFLPLLFSCPSLPFLTNE